MHPGAPHPLLYALCILEAHNASLPLCLSVFIVGASLRCCLALFSPFILVSAIQLSHFPLFKCEGHRVHLFAPLLLSVSLLYVVLPLFPSSLSSFVSY